MPYVQVIANKIGVTQSVNGSWVQAIAEATFSSGGGTASGVTGSVQYNDGSGVFTSDESFIRGDDKFFVNSVVGGNEMSLGAGDWEQVNGIPIIGSGIIYGSDDVTSAMINGDSTGAGGLVGTLILNQDELSGGGTYIRAATNSLLLILEEDNLFNFLSISSDTINMAFSNDVVNNGLSISPDITELVYDNGDYKSEIGLDVNGSVIQFKDEAAGEDYTLTVNTDGVTITTPDGSYTFPKSDGTAGQILSTDGSGQLSWINP